jgi:hypothetical protein
MKNDTGDEVPATSPLADEAQRKRDLRRAIIFGVVMATIEMAVLLYFVYC